MVSRISTGAWRPAETLPSELALAEEFGVSQGTVRKAVDSLVAENLVERRQGKGTYVAQHTHESAQFRFFRLSHESGERAYPSCRESTIERRLADADERDKLDLAPRSDIYEVARTRFVDEKAILREHILLSAVLFPQLDNFQPLPNSVYTLYQSEFNHSINTVKERIKAVSANAEIARALGIDMGMPVLSVERIAKDVAGRPIELRKTYFLTDAMHYAIELS